MISGHEEISIEESGEYVIYLETEGIVDGTRYVVPEDIDAINCRIYNKDKREEIVINKINSGSVNESYTERGLYKFNIDQSGTYILESELVNSNIKNVVLSVKVDSYNLIMDFVFKVIGSSIIGLSGNCIWIIGVEIESIELNIE